MYRLLPSPDPRIDYADASGATGIDLPDVMPLDPAVSDQVSVGAYYDLGNPNDVPDILLVQETTENSLTFAYDRTTSYSVTTSKTQPSEEAYPSIPNLFKLKIRLADVLAEEDTAEARILSIREGATVGSTEISLTKVAAHEYESDVLVAYAGESLSEGATQEFPDYSFLPSSLWVFEYVKGRRTLLRAKKLSTLVDFYTPGFPRRTGYDRYYQDKVEELRGDVADLYPGPLVCYPHVPAYDIAGLGLSPLTAKAKELSKEDVDFWTFVYPNKPTVLHVQTEINDYISRVTDIEFQKKPAAAPVDISLASFRPRPTIVSLSDGVLTIKATGPGNGSEMNLFDLVTVDFGYRDKNSNFVRLGACRNTS